MNTTHQYAASSPPTDSHYERRNIEILHSRDEETLNQYHRYEYPLYCQNTRWKKKSKL